MKKFTLLLAATATASAAFAVQPTTVVRKSADTFIGADQAVKLQVLPAKTEAYVEAGLQFTPATALKSVLKAPEGFSAGILSPNRHLNLGVDPSFGGYKTTAALCATKGTVNFANASTNAVSYEWTWSNGLAEPNRREYSSTYENIAIELIPTQCIYGLQLTATAEDGSTDTASPWSIGYYSGGNWYYWLGSNIGATMYPMGGNATTVGYMCFDTNDATNFNADGVFKKWYDVLPQLEETEDGYKPEITDIKIKGFSNVIPPQASDYMIQSSWLWFQGKFSAPTQLVMKFYTNDADGFIDYETPVAVGYTNVDAGTVGTSSIPVFKVIPLDEDGDEIDGVLVVKAGTNLVARIEGIDEDPNIVSFWPCYGANTLLPMDPEFSPYLTNSYLQLSYNVDGVPVTAGWSCPYLFAESETELWQAANYYWMFDLSFNFVENADGSDNFNIVVDNAGGEGAICVIPLYPDLRGYIEDGYMECSQEGSWFDYEIGEVDETTYQTSIFVNAEALPEGMVGREGYIRFTGMAQDFTIKVQQGDLSGIKNVNAAEAAAEYFDLQGRKLTNAPATGIFIQRQGNQVTKVIR